jgi:hypothetical protein
MRFSGAIIQRMQAIAWWKYAVWDLSGAQLADPERFLDFVSGKIREGISPYGPKLVRVSDILSG